MFALHLLAPALLGTVVPAAPAPTASITQIHYELKFTAALARQRAVDVQMTFTAAAAGPVALSLPAWTPGAYEISNFARQVSQFSATSDGADLVWEKQDYDTWRLHLSRPGTVRVQFRFAADTLDNAMTWSRPDFLLVNGTNVFLYPEGQGFDFPASVSVVTEDGWRVATGMKKDGAQGYSTGNYHDLVDMPFFIGRFDLDSMQIESHWHKLASYPAGMLAGASRKLLWDQLQEVVPAESKVFGETPWTDYTTMVIFDSSYGGGSALEHQSSHVGIYNPGFIGNPLLASITAHEIFHAWNVKRLRPVEMVPYRYDSPQPTPLLWVSEGVTDYYSDLALLRGGVIDSAVFLNVTNGKIAEVAQAPPVGLEDASVSTWIHPSDGTATIYYPKGSLAGLLLDIAIRDASDNRASLDQVMRALYTSTYKAGRGVTEAEWWAALARAAGGKSFDDFAARYVRGRQPFPWATIAPLGGLEFVADSTREIRIGVGTSFDGDRVVVTSVAPGSAAEAAGVAAGDELVSVGGIQVRDAGFGPAFRAKYAGKTGTQYPIVVRRGGQEQTLNAEVREAVQVSSRLEIDPKASPKAARIRAGLFRGTIDR